MDSARLAHTRRPIKEKPNFHKLTGAGAPQGRRAPTWAMTMAKPWPMLASAFNAWVRRVANEEVVELNMLE